MCGRLCMSLKMDELSVFCRCKYKDTTVIRNEYNGGRAYKPGYNITPSMTCPVLVSAHHFNYNTHDDEHIIVPMVFGPTPSSVWRGVKMRGSNFGFPTHNCRIEKLVDTPLFADPIKRAQRCVVLCEGYYEWAKQALPHDVDTKAPYFVQNPKNTSDTRMYVQVHDKMVLETHFTHLAAVYDVWRDEAGDNIYSFCIVTKEATEQLHPLNSRMPVILETDEQIAAWLNIKCTKVEAAVAILKGINPVMTYHKVSRRVNNVKHTDSLCNKSVEYLRKKGLWREERKITDCWSKTKNSKETSLSQAARAMSDDSDEDSNSSQTSSRDTKRRNNMKKHRTTPISDSPESSYNEPLTDESRESTCSEAEDLSTELSNTIYTLYHNKGSDVKRLFPDVKEWNENPKKRPCQHIMCDYEAIARKVIQKRRELPPPNKAVTVEPHPIVPANATYFCKTPIKTKKKVVEKKKNATQVVAGFTARVEPSQQGASGILNDNKKEGALKMEMMDVVESGPSDVTMMDKVKDEPLKKEIKDVVEGASLKMEMMDVVESGPSDVTMMDKVKNELPKKEIKDVVEDEPLKKEIKDVVECASLKMEMMDVVESGPSDVTMMDKVKNELPKKEIKDVVEGASLKMEMMDVVESGPSDVTKMDKVKNELPKKEIKDVVEDEPLKKEIKDVVEGASLKMEMMDVAESGPSDVTMMDKVKNELPKKEIKDVVEGTSLKMEMMDVVESGPSDVTMMDKVKNELPKKEIKDFVEGATPKKEIKDVVEGVSPKMEIKDVVEGASPKLEMKDNIKGVPIKKEVVNNNEDVKDVVEGATLKKEIKEVVEGASLKMEMIDNIEGASIKKEMENNIEGAQPKKEMKDVVEGASLKMEMMEPLKVEKQPKLEKN